MGYDYDSKKILPVQKVVMPLDNQSDSERQVWLDEQAENFESEVKQRQRQAITISEFAENWLADSPKNAYDRNSTDLQWILPQLGAYDLKRLTPRILSDFHSNIKATTALAFTSREHIHRTLCAMLSAAVAQGYLKLNPAFRTFPYEKRTTKAPMVSLEQFRKFVRCLDDELPKHALFYKLLLSTGIKRAECVGLKWSDVDFNNGEVTINKIVVSVPHEPVWVKGTPPRTVYLSANMCALLQSVQNKKVDSYIFEQSNGLPMLPSTFTYRLKLICQKHRLPPDLTMQTIHATHAELLKQQGSTDKKAYLKLQRKLGL